MNGIFYTYLTLGFEHIADLAGYDHILFLVALCAVYPWSSWKKVAILVTAFTLGHSLTLALAALNILNIPANIIEFLIPVTIFITAISNTHPSAMASSEKAGFSRPMILKYVIALFFGLIHGLGFSNFFRQLTMPSQENDLIPQLFSFNVGVELGQLIIVAFILSFSFLLHILFKMNIRSWNIFISGAAAGIALMLMLERIPN
ncbi:MAG: hypothetical protein RLZZ417_590 [Bacteroidota bacterium]|jgi:hypothetical protein